MMSRYLTPVAVAARLSVSRATAHRLIASGVIPAVVLVDRPGRRLIRIREDELERAVDGRRVWDSSAPRPHGATTRRSPTATRPSRNDRS
jgi:excisionase family DNA binding protein